MLNVLFCSPYSTSANVVKGGINTWGQSVLSYSRNITDNKVRLLPVSFDRFTSVNANTTILSRLFNGFNEYRKPLAKAISSIKSNAKPDLVHICTSSGYGVFRDLILLYYSRKFNVKTVLHLHFGRIPELARKNNWEWRLLRYAVKLSTTAVVMTRASEVALCNEGFDNVEYLPNPIGQEALDRIRLLSADSSRIPRRLLYAGHVIKTKGIYELVEACVKIPDVQLKIVGRCFDDIKLELEGIAKARENGVWMDIVGEVNHDEVLSEFLQADMFVFPSYTEGFPNVILEAMACGCPIVSSDVGAIPEMLDIRGKACGICFKPQSVDEIIAAVNKLIDDDSLKQDYSIRSYRRVNEFYTMPVVWNRLVSIWMKL